MSPLFFDLRYAVRCICISMTRNVIKEAIAGGFISLEDLRPIIVEIHDSALYLGNSLRRVLSSPEIIAEYPEEEITVDGVKEVLFYVLRFMENLRGIATDLDSRKKSKIPDPEEISAKISKQAEIVYNFFMRPGYYDVVVSDPAIDANSLLSSLSSAALQLIKISTDIEERVGGASSDLGDIPGSSFRSIDLSRVSLLVVLESALDDVGLSPAKRKEIRDSIYFLQHHLSNKIDDVVFARKALRPDHPELVSPAVLRELYALLPGIERIPDIPGTEGLKQELAQKISNMIKRHHPKPMARRSSEEEFINENSLYDRLVRRMFSD